MFFLIQSGYTKKGLENLRPSQCIMDNYKRTWWWWWWWWCMLFQD